jgi:hypothetical protein
MPAPPPEKAHARWPTLAPEPALSLAALRIVVPIMILLAPGFREGARVARWDTSRWVVPEGLSWFVAHVPIRGDLATAAQVVVAFTALLAAAGIRARASLAVLTVATFYVFSIGQLGGHVWHDMHLLWFAAILAMSPCDDVLAVDARTSVFAEGIVYARPLFVVRLLLSAIYFFPGLHKLMRSGLGWALSDNVRNQMYWKWAEHGVVPTLRLDEPDWVLKLGGLLVLAFELGFPLLLLVRRTRLVAAVVGVVFHVLTELIFFIPFASLWACYVALVDFRPIVRRMRRAVGGPDPPVRESSSPSNFAATAVFGLLVVGAVFQGIRGQVRSYPFACYPTFEWRVGTKMPDLEIALVDPSGAEVALSSPPLRRTQREWAEAWSLLGATTETSAERLRAYYVAELRRTPEARTAADGAARVRFYRVDRSVLPEEQGRIVGRTLLRELPATP